MNQYADIRYRDIQEEIEKVLTAKRNRQETAYGDSFTIRPQPLVYVAGPITGNMMANTREAVYVADIMRENDVAPYVPHLSVAWEMITSYDHRQWLEYDAQIIMRCDALYRMDGDSKGADWEVEYCDRTSTPVFFAAEFETVEAFCKQVNLYVLGTSLSA
jgi:hypothetical protein